MGEVARMARVGVHPVAISLPTRPVIRRAPRRAATSGARAVALGSTIDGHRRVQAPPREVGLLIEGGNALALIHSDPGYIETAGRTARGLVERYHSAVKAKPKRAHRS
jgi:hypothetical protein